MLYNASMFTSYVICKGNDNSRQANLETILNRLEISEFDRTQVSPGDSGTIGIDRVKDLIRSLNLKPLKSQTKAAVIYQAHKMTRESQNALLKTLEEPPENTVVVLVCENESQLLPTIVSRCLIMNTDSGAQGDIGDLADIDNLLKMPPGVLVKHLETVYTDKAGIEVFIHKLLYQLNSQLSAGAQISVLQTDMKTYIKLTHNLITTLKYLGNNVHPKLALESAFLRLK